MYKLSMQQFPAHLKTRGMLVMEHRLGEPIESYLHRRYIVDGATTITIGADLGLNNATVSRWLRDLGIETRLTGQRGVPAPSEAVA
jgi:hypothetical protein